MLTNFFYIKKWVAQLFDERLNINELMFQYIIDFCPACSSLLLIHNFVIKNFNQVIMVAKC